MSNQKHRPRHPQRMDAGALGSLVEGYADHLGRLGHTQLTIGNAVDSARHLAAWLARGGIALCEVDEGAVAQFARHRCRCGGNRRYDRLSAKYVRRALRFVCFLESQGAVRAIAPAQAPQPVDERVAAFQDWLRQHRGISAPTILRYGAMVMRLLPALGAEPRGYDAVGVRRVIVAECRSCSRAYVKTMTTALRGYLRFLAARGECAVGLDHAVPLVPQWRLSALPRYLPEAEIERLIGSCDLAASAGLRDRAILLLLARLGLRAGDVLAMRLDDVDWAAATLRVRGKGRRETRLPLPHDAGDALLASVLTVAADEAYILACYRYIELNPVRAGMVDHPRAYAWSSHRAIAEGAPLGLVSLHERYLALGRDDDSRRAAYRDLFQSALPVESVERVRHATRTNDALGNDRFRAQVEAMLDRRVGPLKRGRKPKG